MTSTDLVCSVSIYRNREIVSPKGSRDTLTLCEVLISGTTSKRISTFFNIYFNYKKLHIGLYNGIYSVLFQTSLPSLGVLILEIRTDLVQ